jgi:predicted GIY-YIG superfamily endonuclease
MWYVYILKSKKKDWRYTGYTNNLKDRFKNHNQKENQSTKHYAPFRLEAYIAVKTEQKARVLEKYFKTGSGRAILLKRILQSPKPGLRSPSAVS